RAAAQRRPRGHPHRARPAGRPLDGRHQARHPGDRRTDPGAAVPRVRHQGQGGHPRRVLPRPRERLTSVSARTKARKRALELLFEAEARNVNVGQLLADRLAAPTTQHPLPEYTATLVEGVLAHWGEINEVLETSSQGWPLERMPSVDRAVLRVATWEIVWNDEVPDPVAIAEAVELVKGMSTDESPRFVNGLLARVSDVKATLA